MAKKNVRRTKKIGKGKATMSAPNFKAFGASLTAAFETGLPKSSATALSKTVIGILRNV